jgi:hypothetical protein
MLTFMVGVLVVLVLVLLLGAAVGIAWIMWRVMAGSRREVEAGDYSLDGNFFSPPAPGRGFHRPDQPRAPPKK